MSDQQNLSPVEHIKLKSRGLRGTLAESTADNITGAVSEDDQQLIKFHGAYQQDDRDRREERELKKLEPAYSFMIRLRIPGGDITARQWREIQDSCDKHASGTVKITTRQTVQYHGIVKAKMKPTMRDFTAMGLDSIAACGDVNRNVLAGSYPQLAPYHAEVFDYARQISENLLPRTKAYQEIWLDGEKLADDAPAEDDPLYKKAYLPRKFKIAIAIPPHNETDIFTNDIGLVAVGEGDEFSGFNIAVGGGMGTTHGNEATYPRLGTVIGFVPKERTLDAVWHIVAIQRDFGNREDRKLARLKYTFDRMGEEAFMAELKERTGFELEKPQPFKFTHRGDIYDWVQDVDGRWYITLFVENGLVQDQESYPVKSALYEIAGLDKCGLRFTANQNVMLTGIGETDKPAFTELLEKHGITGRQVSPTRRAALACVALPTCPLALAEAQRYLPGLLDKVEALQEKHGLADEPISIRMTGCPNGCVRPYVAEIGLVGKGPGTYMLRLGGDRTGQRLNAVYREEVDEAEFLSILDELFASYVQERREKETFGDYTNRCCF